MTGPEGLIQENEPPPFLGTWRRVYLLVIVYLAVLIAILSALSRAWSV